MESSPFGISSFLKCLATAFPAWAQASSPIYSRSLYFPAIFELASTTYGAPSIVPGRGRSRCYAGLLHPVDTTSRGTFECPKCRKTYKWYRGLHRHLKYECGKAPRFKCPHCAYTGKHRSHVYSHIKSNHRNRPVYALDTQQG
ncbi:hypothetical protein KM043_007665 [Ampulex compressa]|nr:hypothetical protein KM043_007665 [Ampulex compressa]